MSKIYACPHCNASLNPEHAIILKAQAGEQQGLFGFHPTPGDYTMYIALGLHVEPGSQWEFYCPVCHTDLQAKAEGKENFSALKLINDDGSDTEVYFSRVAGEKATFVVNQAGVQEQFGDAAEMYSHAYMKYLS